MLNLLLLNFKMARNRIRRLGFADEIKTALFLFINFLFLCGLFIGSYRFLSYLDVVPQIGHLVVNKLLTMVFLASFTMTVFSSIVASFNTIYFSKDLPWLLSTPTRVSKIFIHKALNTAVYASWMIFAAMLPFLSALTVVKRLGLPFLSVALALMIPFLLISSLCGIILSMLLVRLFPARRVRDTMFVIGILFIMGALMIVRFLQPERLLRPEGMSSIAQYLSFLDAPTATYLPSWWLSGAVFAMQGHHLKSLAFYALLLFGCAGALFAVTSLLAEKLFLYGWAENQAGLGRKVTATHRYKKNSPLKALINKDTKIFMRDANQWSQLMFLGALSSVYLFSVYKIPLDTMYLQDLVAFFNAGLIGFVVSAVALRFVFPSISMEGDNFWLVKALPFTEKQYLKEKTMFGSVPVLALALLLSCASGILLKTDAPVFCASVIAVVIMSLGLNFMAAGFGAMFPKFNMTSVAQIEASHGGLIYILAALFYIGINLSLWAVPLQNYYMMKFAHKSVPWNNLLWVAMALAAVNCAAMLVPFKLGIRSLRRLEV